MCEMAVIQPMTAEPVIVASTQIPSSSTLIFQHDTEFALAFNLSCVIIKMINNQRWLDSIPHRLDCRSILGDDIH